MVNDHLCFLLSFLIRTVVRVRHQTGAFFEGRTKGNERMCGRATFLGPSIHPFDDFCICLEGVVNERDKKPMKCNLNSHVSNM